MGDVFKHHTTRYLDADGRQVKKDTPGARKVEEESKNKWYGAPTRQKRPCRFEPGPPWPPGGS
jgi:hypothetical protein